MKVIRGTSRITVTFPSLGFVIKIAYIWVFGRLRDGFSENRRERSFYRRTKHPLLAPTYFSLFGLLNIQGYYPTLEDEGHLHLFRKIWNSLNGATESAVGRDRHHFAHSGNYGMCGDHLVMVDYGGTVVQQVILQYGDKMVECCSLVSPKKLSE